MAKVSILNLSNLTKKYTEGSKTRTILQDVNLSLETGEFFVLLGKSGSGKSTLLNIISGIDAPDSGQVLIDGVDITAMNERARTLYRRDNIGIVFQFFNLIPTLTVVENITLPLELAGHSRKVANQRAQTLLDRVGLGDRAGTFPDKLSGGEQQRVAIARALVHEPALVISDEPTGNLDEDTGKLVLELLLELTRDAGRTLIMATHNPEIVPLADRVCTIHEGKFAFMDTKQTSFELASQL